MSQKKSMFWNYGTYWDIRKVHDEERLLAKNQYHIAIWGWDIGSFMLQWLHTNPCNFVLVLNGLRPWQTRTHCWCFLGAQTRGTQNECCVSMLLKLGNICCGHKMFRQNQTNLFVSATNAARAGKRETFVSATMCPQQCVLVCQGH